jgi:pimeloyl-ACP methyl ester carboxylesterase
MSISETYGSAARRTVTTSFGDIAYIEAGQGPVALFIHGVFLNADLWRQQLAALADLRRCIAVDLLAHGQSPCPPPGRELTLSLQADMIIALLDALKVEAVDLVANDSGGAVAQLIVARAPGRVRTLTLTNCEAHDNFPPESFEAVHRAACAGTLARGLSALAGDPMLARVSLASTFEQVEELSDETVLGFFGPFASPSRAEAVQAYVAGMDNRVTIDIRDDLARFLGPTLIVWGTADETFDVSWARWLAQTIPGTVRCVEVDGAKLFFPLERPDALNRELRELWINAELHDFVNRYLDAWNRHDLAEVMTAHSPDTVFTQRTGAIAHTGRDNVLQTFKSDLAQWPDAHWESIRRTVSENVCVLESIMTATAASPLEALGFTIGAGATVRGRCIDVLTFQDSLITQKDTYLDVIELLASGQSQG